MVRSESLLVTTGAGARTEIAHITRRSNLSPLATILILLFIIIIVTVILKSLEDATVESG